MAFHRNRSVHSQAHMRTTVIHAYAYLCLIQWVWLTLLKVRYWPTMMGDFAHSDSWPWITTRSGHYCRTQLQSSSPSSAMGVWWCACMHSHHTHTHTHAHTYSRWGVRRWCHCPTLSFTVRKPGSHPETVAVFGIVFGILNDAWPFVSLVTCFNQVKK